MEMRTFKADEVKTGYHPLGYLIDKTAEPLNRYTLWTMDADGQWRDAKPVCFHSLPQEGWIAMDAFDWKKDREKR